LNEIKFYSIDNFDVLAMVVNWINLVRDGKYKTGTIEDKR